MEGEEDMIKLFVSDLDDTLVYNVNHMQKEDERAICWLAEKEQIFVLPQAALLIELMKS